MSSEADRALTNAGSTDGATGVMENVIFVFDGKPKHIVVNLFLDRIEVEALLARETLEAVRVHDDGEMLIKQAHGEHLSILSRAAVQEVNSIAREINSTAPQQ